MTQPIYTDEGAQRGLRTRYFRDLEDGTGVEWIYATDHAGGCNRWYGFLAVQGATIASLRASGMPLTRLEPERALSALT